MTASEELLYDHCGALLKIFSVGKDTPEEQLKILQGMKAKYSGVPAMEGSPKDHKEGCDPVKGPITRPLINANVGPNAAVGNITS